VNIDKYDKISNVLNQHFSLDLPESLPEKLMAYHELLSTWNSSAKLLSPTDVRTRLWDHTADSLSLLPYFPDGHLSSLQYVDIGSGGGYPAIPLLLALPRVSTTLVERHQKKATFLNHVIRRLGIERVDVSEDTFAAETLPSGPRIITCRAIEKPESVVPGILASLAPGDVFLCQLDISRVNASGKFCVRRIDDELDRQGLRRGSLHIIERVPK
jgi:16S rRNA (guanine(527)-N(7))-methyltransferase RsmG